MLKKKIESNSDHFHTLPEVVKKLQQEPQEGD